MGTRRARRRPRRRPRRRGTPPSSRCARGAGTVPAGAAARAPPRRRTPCSTGPRTRTASRPPGRPDGRRARRPPLQDDAHVSRFSEPQHPTFRQLNASIGVDWRLGPYDVEQSRAHATMLAGAGIISDADRDALLGGLERVEEELDGGSFAFRDDDEDIHMAIERRLTEIIGPVGGKLHTARSRNDQVATDVALFVRGHALNAYELLTDLMATLVDLADRHLDWPLPGYTHLQRAQPVYLSHHLLAWLWK